MHHTRLKRIFFQVLLGFFVGTLAACSTVSYQEPVDGPVAEVRFVSDAENITLVWKYNDTDCNGESEWMRLRKGFLLNSDPVSLGLPLSENYHKNAFKEFRVLANVEHVFMFKSHDLIGTTMVMCGVPVMASFEEGKQYELAYSYNFSVCKVQVSEVVTVNEGYELRRQKVYTNNPAGFGDQCKAMFNKHRLY